MPNRAIILEIVSDRLFTYLRTLAKWLAVVAAVAASFAESADKRRSRKLADHALATNAASVDPSIPVATAIGHADHVAAINARILRRRSLVANRDGFFVFRSRVL
jgi:hypothetical protein